MAAELEAEDLPTLEGVGTVTTQGTDVVELRIDLLQVIAGFAQMDETISDQEAAEMREAVDSFDTTRAQLVMSYSDHGEVGDLVDGLDAATLDVALIQSAAVLSGPAMMGGTNRSGNVSVEAPATGSSGQALVPEQAPDDGQQVLSEVRDAAVEIEAYHAEHGTYPTSMEDLGQGRSAQGGVLLHIVRADDTSFCVQGISSRTAAAYYDSQGPPAEGHCP